MAELTYEEITRAKELIRAARPLAIDVWMEFIGHIRQFLSTDDLILLEKWTRARWSEDSLPFNVLLLDLLIGADDERLAEIIREYEDVWRNGLSCTIHGFEWGEQWDYEDHTTYDYEEEGHIEFIEMPQFIHPTLDLDDDGIVYLSQQRAMREVLGDGRIIEVMRPVIITSDRRVWHMPHCKRHDEIIRLPNRKAIWRPLERATNRWSLASMQNFLNNGATVNPWALYLDIEQIFKKRVWTPDEGNYVIFALYVILSYVFPVFEAVPYLHLLGLAGSGKTTVAKIMAQLGFNGRIVVDPTEASLFRDIEQDRPLMILDEQENIGTRKAGQEALATILKGGYKKGLTVPRQEKRGAKWVTVNFDIFCCKVIANVYGLEDILADRAIPVIMRRIPPDLESQYRQDELTQAAVQDLIDNLYLFTMLHMPRIAAFAKNANHRLFSGRTNEIFSPLLTLAAYFDIECDGRPNDRELYHELATTLKMKAEQRQSSKMESPEEMLRQALWNLLNGAEEGEFSSQEIAIEFYALHTSPPNYFNDVWLGRTLAKMDIVRGEADKRRAHHAEEVPHFDYRTGDLHPDWLVKKRLTYYRIRADRL